MGLAIIAALMAYLVARRDQFQNLRSLDLTLLAWILPLALAGSVISALVVSRLVAALGTRTDLGSMFLLQNATSLLNYLPMKAGAVFRANYLKRRYGFRYGRYGLFFLHLTLMMTATGSGAGLAMLAIRADWSRPAQGALAALFAGLLAASVILLAAPLPAPRGPGRWKSALRNVLAARRELSGNAGTQALCAGLLSLNFAMSAVRLGIIFYGIGAAPHPADMPILVAMAYASMFVSLTPGSLGVRELTLGAGGVILGYSPEASVLASMIDRAIAMAWAFAVGMPCVLWLWHKYPADFRDAPARPDAPEAGREEPDA